MDKIKGNVLGAASCGLKQPQLSPATSGDGPRNAVGSEPTFPTPTPPGPAAGDGAGGIPHSGRDHLHPYHLGGGRRTPQGAVPGSPPRQSSQPGAASLGQLHQGRHPALPG